MPDIEKTRKYVKMVAEQRGWILTSEEEMLEGLIEGLAINLERYGWRYCPCRLVNEEDLEKDKDIICPCAYAEPDIEEYGHCYCSLYCSKDYIEQGGEIRKIPERRPTEDMS